MNTNALLPYEENYGIYAELVRRGFMIIYTRSLSSDNIRDHYAWLMNIFRDGIELEEVHAMKVKVIFEDNEEVVLSVFEYFMNLIFWYPALSSGDRLTSRFFFWVENFTASDIKKYIDDNYIDIHRSDQDIKTLNNKERYII